MTYLSEEESRKLVRQIEARGRVIQKMLKEIGLEGITGAELVHESRQREIRDLRILRESRTHPRCSP